LVRALADGSAVVALGLAAVPTLDIDRYRGELIRRATAPLTIAAAVWLLAELLRLGVAAAQAAAIPVSRLGLHTTVEFAQHTTAGRSGLFSAVAVGLVCVAVVAAYRNRTMWLPAARSHRATAVVSRSRALVELAIMAVALTLAAALAVTG
jgi:putative copper resistance protein D